MRDFIAIILKRRPDFFKQHGGKESVITELPKYALEVIAFGSMLFIMLYLPRQKQKAWKIYCPLWPSMPSLPTD